MLYYVHLIPLTLPNFPRCTQSLRSAYHESVALGQELSKRINDDPTGKTHGNDDDSDWSDGDNDGEFQTEMGTQNSKKRNHGSTASRAAKEMNQVLDGEEMPAATGSIPHPLEVLVSCLVDSPLCVSLTYYPSLFVHHQENIENCTRWIS